MLHPTGAAPAPTSGDAAVESAWTILLAAARHADRAAATDRPASFALAVDGQLHVTSPDDPGALLAWRSDSGWEPLLPAQDPRLPLLDLYLPICSATTVRPITVGHLGQSLDGFIATPSGDSQFVTGHENILHLHRMRALSDAVIVGAGTVAADDPQLTTRHVHGPNPLRVIFDPTRRLSHGYRVFTDRAASTLYVCGRSLVSAGETEIGGATIVGIDDDAGVASVLGLLRERGCRRVFVEGGGVTVSAFLEADLLDRLHMAIAPVIIGDGRPAIRVPARMALRDCRRPRYRVFRMGGDVLFDCEINTQRDDRDAFDPAASPLTRII